MELRQLRYFIGASEAGSLLRASGQLGVAQPALGQQITALEQEVGTRLLERSSRGVRLTPAGQVFLEHARVVLADAERARSAVQDLTRVPRGEVALGLTHTVALAAAVPILRASRDRLPDVRLKLVEAYSGFLRERLLAGQLDMAVLYGDRHESGLATRPLLDDQLVLVSGEAATDLSDPLSPADLTDLCLILPGREHDLRRTIEAACAPMQVQLNVVAEVDSLISVKRATEDGLARTILPAGSVAAEVASGRLFTTAIDSPAMRRRVVTATHFARPASAAAAAMLKLVEDVLATMVGSGAWPARWLGKAGPDSDQSAAGLPC